MFVDFDIDNYRMYAVGRRYGGELIEDVFDFGREIPITTWYHFPALRLKGGQ